MVTSIIFCQEVRDRLYSSYITRLMDDVPFVTRKVPVLPKVNVISPAVLSSHDFRFEKTVVCKLKDWAGIHERYNSERKEVAKTILDRMNECSLWEKTADSVSISTDKNSHLSGCEDRKKLWEANEIPLTPVSYISNSVSVDTVGTAGDEGQCCTLFTSLNNKSPLHLKYDTSLLAEFDHNSSNPFDDTETQTINDHQELLLVLNAEMKKNQTASNSSNTSPVITNNSPTPDQVPVMEDSCVNGNSDLLPGSDNGNAVFRSSLPTSDSIEMNLNGQSATDLSWIDSKVTPESVLYKTEFAALVPVMNDLKMLTLDFQKIEEDIISSEMQDASSNINDYSLEEYQNQPSCSSSKRNDSHEPAYCSLKQQFAAQMGFTDERFDKIRNSIPEENLVAFLTSASMLSSQVPEVKGSTVDWALITTGCNRDGALDMIMKVRQLVDMGFPEKDATGALTACQYSIIDAVEYLSARQ